MEIGSTGHVWIDKIESIKSEVTEEVALILLGDFNWRPRLVGSYVSAVKGYDSLIDIIGVHLLKSELCCVGHIYALTLAFFNTDKSIEYLDRYLSYYLTRPELYFDQGPVLEALLYIDSINHTSLASQHKNAFDKMQNDRKMIEIERSRATAKMIQEHNPNFNVKEYLDNTQKMTVILFDDIKINWVASQIAILKDLNTYSH